MVGPISEAWGKPWTGDSQKVCTNIAPSVRFPPSYLIPSRAQASGSDVEMWAEPAESLLPRARSGAAREVGLLGSEHCRQWQGHSCGLSRTGSEGLVGRRAWRAWDGACSREWQRPGWVEGHLWGPQTPLGSPACGAPPAPGSGPTAWVSEPYPGHLVSLMVLNGWEGLSPSPLPL